MPRYVALSKSAHRDAGLVPVGHSHALDQAVVPLVAEELPQVLPTMAVAFVQSPDSGYQLVALQSLQPGVNVYVHINGRWIGGYRPAWYREYPFRLIPDDKGERQVVCIDESSDAFQAEAGEQATRLFDDSGELTERTRATITFLEKLERARAVTRKLVAELDEAGLIVPWNVSASSSDNGEGQAVKGLFHIDEAAMKALSPDVVSGLLASGALSVAYTQLLSEHRLQGLARLYELRSKANQQQQSAEEVDLEDLFGDDDDDLKFDF